MVDLQLVGRNLPVERVDVSQGPMVVLVPHHLVTLGLMHLVERLGVLLKVIPPHTTPFRQGHVIIMQTVMAHWPIVAHRGPTGTKLIHAWHRRRWGEYFFVEAYYRPAGTRFRV